MVDYEEFVKEKASESEYTEDEIRAKVETAKNQAKNKFASKSKEFREGKVVNKVSEWLDKASALTQKTVDVLNATDEIDTVARQRNRAIERFDKNPQKAIDDGLTNKSGEPVWTGGPNEGDPMPEHIWKRFVYGIDEDGKLVKINAREDLFDTVDNMEEQTRVRVGLLEGGSEEDDRLHMWNLSSYSNPRTQEELDREGIVERLNESEALEDMNEVRTLIEEEEYTPVIVKGFADRISRQEDVGEDQSPRVTLVSPDRQEDITVWLNDGATIDFNDGSLVYLIGSLRFGQRYRDDMEKDPLQTAGVYGLIPDPEGTLEEDEEDIML